MKKNTKQRLLEVGAQIMHEKGFGATGIQEVLKTAEVPKGSFYFYFKSKEDFGIEVLDCFFNHFKANMEPFIKDESKTHIGRIQNFLTHFLDFFVNGDYKGGCPIGNFSLEMSDVNDRFRNHLKGIINLTCELISDQIKLAQENNEIMNMGDAKSLADFIFFSWEGMIMQMKVEKTEQALHKFNHFIFEQLLQKQK
jgi:TetR/AcrR family transcriptional repressor of nem operon